MLKLRSFRPLPGAEIAEIVERVGAVAVMDRSISYGLAGGPLFNEIRSFVNGRCPLLINYVYGLGGRDVSAGEIEGVFAELAAIRDSGEPGEIYRYLGLRE